MFDGISFMDDLPKYDKYDEDYTKVNSSKPSAGYFWEEEDQLQLKYDNHPVHIDYENNEENEENLRVREKYLPLCFSSFKFLRENYTQTVNSRNGESSNESIEDVIDDMEVVLAPKLQPLNIIDFQTEDELMQHNCVPLSFNSFHFLKMTLEHVLNDKHLEN
jgi:hypothetical protein